MYLFGDEFVYWLYFMIFIYIYINDVICRELNGYYYKRNFIFLIDLFIEIKYKLFKYKIIFKI